MEETRGRKGKAIIAIDKDLNVVEYESQMAAEASGSYKYQHINGAIHGRLKTYRGFVWYIKEDAINKGILREDGTVDASKIENSAYRILLYGGSAGKMRAVRRIQSDGTVTVYNCIRDAENANGFIRDSLIAHLQGRRKLPTDDVWEYVEKD